MNRLLQLNDRILRNYLKSGLIHRTLFSADLDFPSRLHHHLALTRPGEVMVKVGGRTLLSSRIRAHSLN